MTALKPAPRVALIQLYIPYGKTTPSSQFQRAATFIRAAAADHADLVILPEMALGHPTPETMAQYSRDCQAELLNFQALAKELSVNIIPGSLCEDVLDADGQHLHYSNTTYYIDRTGTTKLSYRKVNLWGDERKAFTKGNTHEIIDTDEFGKLGLLICWDLAFPEAFRALAKLGARVVVIPILWKLADCGPKGLAVNPDSERIFINSVLSARAYEQNMCVIMCNTGGPADEGHFGCSQITLPFKGPLVKMNGDEGISVTAIEFNTIIEDAEDVWNIRADINSPGWYNKGQSSTSL
ncbi:hypothetical protein G7Z17_g2214 [Cylindrodendrum hubeiense]|uniref:CN hydrolase domain-containing protein n=1 Tax=Cylindrodendrum hubeiense TaxID=595255 RepID=A0A9P5LL91_9HYPO|nr:hypothetical protein G7Z17_g2214 [Cylindrodendrum hubeiense]